MYLLFNLTASAKFTSPSFLALIQNNTSPGDRLQTIVAIGDHSGSEITYSIEENSYVEVDFRSGDIRWKGPSPPNNTGSKNYTFHSHNQIKNNKSLQHNNHKPKFIN